MSKTRRKPAAKAAERYASMAAKPSAAITGADIHEAIEKMRRSGKSTAEQVAAYKYLMDRYTWDSNAMDTITGRFGPIKDTTIQNIPRRQSKMDGEEQQEGSNADRALVRRAKYAPGTRVIFKSKHKSIEWEDGKVVAIGADGKHIAIKRGWAGKHWIGIEDIVDVMPDTEDK